MRPKIKQRDTGTTRERRHPAGGFRFSGSQLAGRMPALPVWATRHGSCDAGRYCSMSRKNFGLVAGPVWLVSVKVNTSLLNHRAGLARMDQLAYGSVRLVVH